MKYLKRIFESNDMDVMKTYIYDCFVDFLDEDARAEFDEDQDTYEIIIKIKSFRENNRLAKSWDNKNIERFITSIDRLKEASTLIEECVSKVQIKYPDIEYSVALETNENSIHNMYIHVNFYLGQEELDMIGFGDDSDDEDGWIFSE